MMNNPYYFKGFRDARAGAQAVWGEGWTKEQCDAYERGFEAGF